MRTKNNSSDLIATQYCFILRYCPELLRGCFHSKMKSGYALKLIKRNYPDNFDSRISFVVIPQHKYKTSSTERMRKASSMCVSNVVHSAHEWRQSETHYDAGAAAAAAAAHAHKTQTHAHAAVTLHTSQTHTHYVYLVSTMTSLLDRASSRVHSHPFSSASISAPLLCERNTHAHTNTSTTSHKSVHAIVHACCWLHAFGWVQLHEHDHLKRRATYIYSAHRPTDNITERKLDYECCTHSWAMVCDRLAGVTQCDYLCVFSHTFSFHNMAWLDGWKCTPMMM